MWTRSELKNNAKQVLARCYPAALLVSLIFAVLSGSFSDNPSAATGRGNAVYAMELDELGETAEDEMEELFEFEEDEYFYFLPRILSKLAVRELGLLVLGFTLSLMLLSVAIKLLITNPIEVGSHRFFMSSRERFTRLKAILYVFSSGKYWNVVKILLIRDVKIFLWTLLLVIPGIVKSYEYQMVSYILAENPGISTGEAFELSRSMTDGEKFNLFVLDLSFLPWMILSAFTCGLAGIFWLNPYTMATKAEAYALFRKSCLDTGRTNSYVLPGF